MHAHRGIGRWNKTTIFGRLSLLPQLKANYISEGSISHINSFPASFLINQLVCSNIRELAPTCGHGFYIMKTSITLAFLLTPSEKKRTLDLILLYDMDSNMDSDIDARQNAGKTHSFPHRRVPSQRVEQLVVSPDRVLAIPRPSRS